MVRDLLAERPPLQISHSIINVPCSYKHIAANSQLWASSHPRQQQFSHFIHFISMPRNILLWEVESNVAVTFVKMNGQF